MIAGRQAFKANSTVALVLAVTRPEPEPLRKYSPNESPELEAIVSKWIAKDPSLRFADGNGGTSFDDDVDVERPVDRFEVFAAIAVVGTPPRSTAPSGSAARKDRKADCAQPYTVDAKGNRIPKLHCL